MATAPNLPTNVAAGTAGHSALHNDTNTAVNLLRNDVDALAPAELVGPEGVGVEGLSMQLVRIGPLVCCPSGSWDTYHGLYEEDVIPLGYRPYVVPGYGGGARCVAVDGNAGELGAVTIDGDGNMSLNGTASDAWQFRGIWLTTDPMPE